MSEFKDINVGIAGFEMPKCCIDCTLYDHFTGCCAILDKCIYDEEEEDNDFWVEKQRYYACPLREISFEKRKEENESE